VRLTKLPVEEILNVGVQMRVTTDLNTNVKNMISYIRYASLRRINLLCFPECSLTGYIVNHVKLNYKAIAQSLYDLQRVDQV
jgi:predicted amidohydrolase